MIEQRLRNLVISGFGVQLHREQELIKIVQKEGEEEKITRLTPRGLEQVIITSDCSISYGFVQLLLENNVDLVFIGEKHKSFARVVRGDQNFITDLWRKQILMSIKRRLELAIEIMSCAIYNKIRLLQSLAKNRPDISFNDEVNSLNQNIAMLESASDNEKIIGIEGESSRIYWSALRKIIPEEFKFEKREKHPPPDPINAMLGYGYTVLKSRVEYGLMLAGLNPYEGIIHSSYRERPALSFDLMEEFRQPIVDRVVITQIVQKQFHPKDFEYKDKNICWMGEIVKKAFLEALYSRFEDKYTYKGQVLEFLDIIFEEAKNLANAIKNDEKYVGFKYR